jgi:hypothetical protein
VKTVAIVQSNYIPWKGYFDLIQRCDEFILFDDAQFTRRDWRNRNRIKTPQGVRWLTVPVEVKGKYLQKINETAISDPTWPRHHMERLRHCYARAPFFDAYRPLFEDLYARAQGLRMLSDVNRLLLAAICEQLGIRTRLSASSDYTVVEGRTERLVSLCRQAGATRYLSGPSARAYLDEGLFRREGLEVAYMDYSGYPEYEQVHAPFEHAVSIVDVIFCTGPEAPRYLRGLGARESSDRQYGLESGPTPG